MTLARIAKHAATWLAICGAWFAAILVLTANRRHLDDALREHGAVATATVTSSSPNNHNTICYTYQVDGRSYAGCGAANFDKSAAQLAPGDATHVTYDVREPGTSCCCRPVDPQRRFVEHAIGGLWMGTWMTLFLGIRAWRREKKRVRG